MLTIYFIIGMTVLSFYLMYKGIDGIRNKNFKLMIYPNKVMDIKEHYFAISILFIVLGSLIFFVEIIILILKLLGIVHFK